VVARGGPSGRGGLSADFSRLAAHLAAGVVEHADRDGLTGARRAVFLDRGGHAPGEHCPTATPWVDPMLINPNWPYEPDEAP
jgi:hypothetical protein